jgi:hypothetical protein
MFEVNEHITIPWEKPIPMPIKLQPNLFHLLPCMLKKFNWENSFLDDFKARLARYHACLEGWDEWINIVFMASFGLWTHKDQVSQSLVYEISGLRFIGF